MRKSNCDSPDLWAQMKAAKENLFSSAQFSNKYRSPSGSGTVIGKHTSQYEPISGTGKATPFSPSPASSKTGLASSNAATGGPTRPTSLTVKGFTASEFQTGSRTPRTAFSNNRPESNPPPLPCSPRLKSSSQSRPRPCLPLTYAKAVPIARKAKALSRQSCDIYHAPDIPSLSSSYLESFPYDGLRPCIPLTNAEALLIAQKANPTPHQSCIPRIEVDLVPGTPQFPTQVEHQYLPRASLLAPIDSSKARTVISPEFRNSLRATMNESDESDEIVLPGKWTANDALRHHGTRPFNVSTRPPHDPEAMKLATPNDLLKTSDRRISQASTQWTEGLHKGVGLPSDDQTGQPTSSAAAMKENCRSDLVVDDELERLQKEIVINAHRRAREDSTASPEMLSRCRDGPGTDRTSQFNRELGNIRVFPQGIPDSSYLPGSSHIFSTEIQENAEAEQPKRELCGRLRLYRDSYKKSPKAFPILTANGGYILLPTPTEVHESVLARIQADRKRVAEPVTNFNPANQLSANGNQRTQVLRNSWTDPAIVDWEYCPRGLARSDSDEVAYRARFQNWLESTIKCERAVDIFRQAFFNGFAHADGETSMFILDMRNYETHLDPNDKESWLHAHETVAGYCYNINLQEREAEEAEEHRRRMELELRREARREPLRSPRSPRSPVANIYLRPVDVKKDTADLREIYNWYMQHSFVSPNIHALDEDEVRQRIEECRSTNLPFIVAIDRGAEKVLGYALAREFDRHTASRFTAELEIYVKDEHTNLGIGRCLLDKLLEICDPTYTPKRGCSFETSKEERSEYYPGGKRRLARLIFTLCYVDMKAEDISKYKRVQKWLKQRGQFEEQGLLRGIRVKNNYLINVVYLVRTTGHSQSNKMDF